MTELIDYIEAGLDAGCPQRVPSPLNGERLESHPTPMDRKALYICPRSLHPLNLSLYD